jgi:RNA polymerase sigma-70 factor (ECF subfamily)
VFPASLEVLVDHKGAGASVPFPDEFPFAAQVRYCARKLARQGVGALGELFDLTAARALRYACALTRNQHDGEDALSAAMVRVALHPRSVAEARHPWAYLLRIVRNEALKITLKRRADLQTALVAKAWVEQEQEEFDTGQFVRDAVARLPASQSEVIILKIWEGLTFAEIAEVLGESPNTAASRYRYAVEKLTQYLASLSHEVCHAERSIRS